MTSDIMIDLETAGSGPKAAILSLAAVSFDLTGQGIAGGIYHVVDLASSVSAGGEMSPSTFYWWLKQSDAARREIWSSEKVAITTALQSLADFIRDAGGKRVWSHGATFDLVILASAYAALGMEPPWAYNAARDTRTIIDLAGVKQNDIPVTSAGTAHNALDDACKQVEWVQHCHRLLVPATTRTI